MEMHLSDPTERFNSRVLQRLWSPFLEVSPEGSPSQSLLNTTLPLEADFLQLRSVLSNMSVVLPQPLTWMSFWEGVKRLHPGCIASRPEVLLSWLTSDGFKESIPICETNIPKAKALDDLVREIRRSEQKILDVRLNIVRMARVIDGCTLANAR